MHDPAHMPGHLIRRLQQIAVAVYYAETDNAGIDLTPVQYAAMATLLDVGEIDQITLAGLIAYDRSTIAGVIDRLVQKGYVERQVSPTDRRARILHLTETGRQILAHAKPHVEKAQQNMLMGLEENEKEQFLGLLNKIIAAGNDQSRAPMRKD